MWMTKACPKCGGDVYQERQLSDREVRCLQCGHTLNAHEVAVAEARRLRQPPAPAIPSRLVPAAR